MSCRARTRLRRGRRNSGRGARGVPLRPAEPGVMFRPDARYALPEAGEATVEIHQAGRLHMQLIAADPEWLDGDLVPFTAAVAPGTYPVGLAVARLRSEPRYPRVAAARLTMSDAEITGWELAVRPGQDPRTLGDGQFFGFGFFGFGFGVGSGMACFVDAAAGSGPGSSSSTADGDTSGSSPASPAHAPNAGTGFQHSSARTSPMVWRSIPWAPDGRSISIQLPTHRDLAGAGPRRTIEFRLIRRLVAPFSGLRQEHPAGRQPPELEPGRPAQQAIEQPHRAVILPPRHLDQHPRTAACAQHHRVLLTRPVTFPRDDWRKRTH